MNVVNATMEDIRGWLELAAEVESLFGPMVDDPNFTLALEKISDDKALFVYEKTMVRQVQDYLELCYSLHPMPLITRLGGYLFQQ